MILDLEEQSVYDYLKRLTDVHRLHLFDIVMQYRAIFSDDSSMQVTTFSKVRLPLQFCVPGPLCDIHPPGMVPLFLWMHSVTQVGDRLFD